MSMSKSVIAAHYAEQAAQALSSIAVENPVIRLEADVRDVEQGAYFAQYRRPILPLDVREADTFPVFVEVRHLTPRTDLLPRERCAHFWTEWTRFGDAECRYCGTMAWSPYFMADDVFGDESVRNMVRTWDRLEEQAGYWEGHARDLTNAWHAAQVQDDGISADGAL